jgi:hypothetical protein
MNMKRKLYYRRQFLLTKVPITLFPDWVCLQIDEYYLYAHPDLEVNRSADPQKSIIAVIGSIYDSAEPQKGNSDILKDITDCAHSLEGLVSWMKRYAGRYALLYKNEKDAVILSDAFGLREIYYCTKDNQIVCGSQPNLVAKFGNPEIKPTSNHKLLDFYRNHLKNSSWIGDETYYEGVKHLLPNHYLDINRREAYRYWPNGPIMHLDLDEAVSRICTFLRGIMRAMVHRHPVMMAVTAGMDSRTLLAASKGIQDKIYYFINNEGLGYSHPDISVPKKIFESIGVTFHVHDVPGDVYDEFRRIFLENVFLATERILPTIYNVYFKNHSDKVNIHGTGEIGRTRFGKEPSNLNSYRLAYKLEYKEGPYVIEKSEKILAELLPVARKFRINILSLFQWEQRKGNRSAAGNSESDIAIEEVDPFDSHLLIELFWGVDGRYTKFSKFGKNILFREMIRSMWPELLKWPINPPYTMRDKITWVLGEVGMLELLKELKYQVNYVKHLYKERL